MSVQGPTGQTTIHEKFSEAINGIQGLCENLKGKTVTTLQKNICKGIISLCKQYNNSIYSIQGHDRRVVARAYQAYKKKSNSIGDATKINNNNFSEKALNATFVTTLQGKDLKAFTMLLTNDSTVRNDFVEQNIKDLLNSQNKAIFNKLPMVVQKALFNNLPLEEKKAFVQSQITVNKEYFQEILQSCDRESKISNTQSTFIELLSKETLDANDTHFITNNQVVKDLKRGYQFEFIAENGQKIEIKNNANNLQPLSHVEIFQEIQKQVKEKSLTEKDKEHLADFLANHVAQGVFATHYQDPNIVAGQCLHWEGNNKPLLIIEYKGDKTSVIVKTESDGSHIYLIHDAPCEINIETKAEVVFTYPKSIGECKCKASNIEVKHFEQQIGDVTFY